MTLEVLFNVGELRILEQRLQSLNATEVASPSYVVR